MISFVVPAHKEQACLGRTLQAIHESARWVCRTKSFRPPHFSSSRFGIQRHIRLDPPCMDAYSSFILTI